MDAGIDLHMRWMLGHANKKDNMWELYRNKKENL